MGRLDEEGPRAIVQVPEPVNRFPDFVHYVVRRLKVFCTAMGKVKLAQVLCRAGLHLAPTTVARMIRQEPPRRQRVRAREVPGRVVTAKGPNHLWLSDLTTVPTSLGFWCAWVPFSLPQRWPFCWWLAVAVDHRSRRIMGSAVFDEQPTSKAVRAFLDRAIRRDRPRRAVHGRSVRSLVPPARNPPAFRRGRQVRQHRGHRATDADDQDRGHAAIAARAVPAAAFQARDLTLRRLVQHAPHDSLGYRTPEEMYHDLPPAALAPRFETRRR